MISGNGLWVAVGQGGLITKSTDRNNWTAAATKGGLTTGRKLAYGKDETGAGRWVAVGNGGIIANSPDGNTWTQSASLGGITIIGFGVAFNNEII